MPIHKGHALGFEGLTPTRTATGKCADQFFVSFDIVALYPSMDQQATIEAVRSLPFPEYYPALAALVITLAPCSFSAYNCVPP